MSEEGRRALRFFAEILDYPGPGLLGAVGECEALVSAGTPEAAELLHEFRAFSEEEELGRLQEIYTGAFDLDTLSDLDATFYPYVGHHLFGESYKRSAFLVGLHERFRAHGFTVEGELPDHLVVLLRFAAACPDEELVEELVREAVIPALERMVGGDEEPEEPAGGRTAYRHVLRALLLVLSAEARTGAELEHAGGAA